MVKIKFGDCIKSLKMVTIHNYFVLITKLSQTWRHIFLEGFEEFCVLI